MVASGFWQKRGDVLEISSTKTPGSAVHVLQYPHYHQFPVGRYKSHEKTQPK